MHVWMFVCVCVCEKSLNSESMFIQRIKFTLAVVNVVNFHSFKQDTQNRETSGGNRMLFLEEKRSKTTEMCVFFFQCYVLQHPLPRVSFLSCCTGITYTLCIQSVKEVITDTFVIGQQYTEGTWREIIHKKVALYCCKQYLNTYCTVPFV